jgi:hypothetical protein
MNDTDEIIGYKASTDQVCRGKKYNVGRTYKLRNECLPVMCSEGFHFCKNANDVLRYYPFAHNFVLFEVIAKGHTIDDNYGGKSCTNKIHIKRIIPKEEYHTIFKDDEVFKFEFHKTGSIKSIKNKMTQWIKRYDKKGNLIYKNRIGGKAASATKWKYNENNVCIMKENSLVIYKYDDEKGRLSRLIWEKDKFTNQTFTYTYDEHGNRITNE